jgi:glycosyltransferase involved in cell wall biosynthesis
MKKKKKKILIGINCLDVNENYNGGINSFLDGILKGLCENKLNDNYIIFCSKNNKNFFKKYKKFFKIQTFDYKKKFYYFFYLISSFFNSEKLFLFFNYLFTNKIFKKIFSLSKVLYTPTSTLTSYFFKGKNMVSPHDLQHIYFKKNFNYFRLKFRNISFKLTICNSDTIQASSKMIKDNILENFSIQKNKVVIIPEGVDYKKFKYKKKIENIIVFFPAYWWPHKNHNFIINCFKKLIFEEKINCKLIMCGGLSFINKIKMLILNKQMKKNIIHKGVISNKELIKLYQRSNIVLSPATYESSSLPILEAIASNNLVLASNTRPNKDHQKIFDINLYKLNNEKSFINEFRAILKKKSTINRNFTNQKKIKSYSWLSISKQYDTQLNKLK